MCRKLTASVQPGVKHLACFLSFFMIAFLHVSSAQAETVLKFDPLISVEEMYDDNIFLSRSNTRSDWITTVSPGFFTSVANPRYNADLRYMPGFVNFLHNPFDYTSQEVTFNGTAEITSRLTASLYEFYIRSNDVQLDEMVDTDYERSIRRGTRTIFNRNLISPQLIYSYGTDNSIRLNYRNTNYRSADPEDDDYRENFVEGQLDHWFNVRNGLSLLCHFTKGNFDEESDLLHSIDITPRYRHRFTPHFELYGEYGYGIADFEETRLYRTLENGRELQTGLEDNEDYNLQKFNVGFEWQLPQNLRLLGRMGYFWRNGRADSDEQGLTSLVTIEKAARNITFNLGWESGYSANYFAVRDEGFTKFWEVQTGATYTYHNNLELHIRGSYGFEDYASQRGITAPPEEDREDYSYAALFQVTYHILRNYGYLSDLAVEFTFNHRELDSDLDTDYYISNRSIGKITATF